MSSEGWDHDYEGGDSGRYSGDGCESLGYCCGIFALALLVILGGAITGTSWLIFSAVMNLI